MGEAPAHPSMKNNNFFDGSASLDPILHMLKERYLKMFLSMNFGVCVIKEAVYGLSRIMKRSVRELYLPISLRTDKRRLRK